MQNRSYKSEGIILFRNNYSEADRIITLYSKHFGKKTMIAKGVRKLTSRKRGGLEVFSKVKFSAVEGRGMDILTEVELIDSFVKIRSDLKKISVAYFFTEVVNKMTREGDELGNLYQILVKYFEELTESIDLKSLRNNFSKDILIVLGFISEKESEIDMDQMIESIINRKLYSKRVAKKVLASKQ